MRTARWGRIVPRMVTIPSSNRRNTYTAVATTGPFPIDFPLFDGTGADLHVTLDGNEVVGWTFSGTLEPGQYGEPNTWTNGSISFAAPISGALVLSGRRSPRRQSQYQEGRGVPARDQNTENNIHVATAQELRRDVDDVAAAVATFDDRFDELADAAADARAAADAAEVSAEAAAASAASLTFATQTEQRQGSSTARIMSPAGVAEHVAFNLGLTRSQIATRYIPVNAFRVTGESAHGDIGAGALYVRGTSGGLRAVQDAAGTWWNLSLTGALHVVSGWFGVGAAALQAAINAAYGAAIVSVFASPGTYTLAASLSMQPGVRVWANPGSATITQGNAANLTTLIDFATNSANGASLVGLIIDGNLANNTVTTTDKFAVNISSASDVVISGNEIRNFTGHGVYVTSGMRPAIRDNFINNVNMYGVYVNAPALGTANAPLIKGNRLEFCGWHGIVVIRSTDAVIEGNRVVCQRLSGIVVNVSGTTVTWVSGPNFANVVPGNFIIYNGGIEALVTAKASNTSLTINYAAGNGTNLPAALGAADVICSWSSNNTRIANNLVKGGASLAFSVYSDQVTFGVDDLGCVVENNIAEGIGSAGYSAQSSGTGTVRSCAFRNNQAIECGLNTTASAAPFNSGFTISGAVNNIILEGNQAISYGSAMTPIHLSATTAGQVFTANNRYKTNLEGITNGASISSSTGFGSGATLTINQCSDDYVLLTVVTGSGPSASPSFTLAHKNLPIRRKMPSAQMIGTTGALMQLLTYLPDNASDTTIVFSGTPGASTTYYVLVRL